MDNDFFKKPILNSPYEYPVRHWELDALGQPTQRIIESRRRAEFIVPVPKARKHKAAAEQKAMVFDEGKGLSTQAQQYDPTPIINELRQHKRRLVNFFSGRMLTDISTDGIREYRDFRRQQPLKNRADRTVKGATVNRELETLQGLFKLAVQRSYIQTNPTLNVEHFPEVRERPAKKRITTEEYLRILEKAPAYLRVGILLLEQTGNRTYSELFTLRWEQVDLDAGVISFNTPLKTAESDTAHPLSDLAVKALRWWREQTLRGNPFIFPSPRLSDQPIRNVRKAWAKTLEDAEVGYFPIYQLRHAFCTRVSKVASDAVVTKAMRHSSAETKRRYQSGMVEEVREAMNLANTEAFGQLENHIFSTVTSPIATNRKEDAAELVET